MERAIFKAVMGGLLGITAFGGLALVGSGPGTPAAPSSRPEGEWRLLDPVTYENSGRLLRPVGCGTSRIVPVGAPPLPLDVFCVEHGRWTGSAQFAAANTIVHPSVRESAAVDQAQTKVWESVRNGTNAKAAPSAPRPQISSDNLQAAIAGNGRTEAYEKIYESRAVGVSIDDFANEVQRRFTQATSGLKNERVVGVVVAYGGDVAWSDIFASGDLFDHYWRKLLRSYAVEALTRPSYRQAASRENANKFLRRLNGRETQETEPGVYRWREIREGQLAQIELDALQPKPMTLHRLLLHRTS